MDLEGIMLSEISQSDTDKHHMISLICGIEKAKQTSKQTKSKIRPRHTENKLMRARGKWDGGMGEMDEEDSGTQASSYQMTKSVTGMKAQHREYHQCYCNSVVC